MREAWDLPPIPVVPAAAVFTLHMVPETGRRHAIRHGSDCWCEPVARWCEEGCCRIIAHVPEGLNGDPR